MDTAQKESEKQNKSTPDYEFTTKQSHEHELCLFAFLDLCFLLGRRGGNSSLILLRVIPHFHEPFAKRV